MPRIAPRPVRHLSMLLASTALMMGYSQMSIAAEPTANLHGNRFDLGDRYAQETGCLVTDCELPLAA